MEPLRLPFGDASFVALIAAAGAALAAKEAEQITRAALKAAYRHTSSPNRSQ